MSRKAPPNSSSTHVGDACFISDILERAIATIVIEDASTDTDREQIGVAVIIVSPRQSPRFHNLNPRRRLCE
jgi:hypothetical protein